MTPSVATRGKHSDHTRRDPLVEPCGAGIEGLIQASTARLIAVARAFAEEQS